MVMEGDTAAALVELNDQYERGADPIVVLNDLLDLAHWLTRLKIVPDADDDATLPPEDIQRGKEMAERLPINVLTRTWQMLLKTLKVDGYVQYKDQFWRPEQMSMHNHQTGRSTDLEWRDYQFDSGLDENRDFSTNSLRRIR